MQQLWRTIESTISKDAPTDREITKNLSVLS